MITYFGSAVNMGYNSHITASSEIKNYIDHRMLAKEAETEKYTGATDGCVIAYCCVWSIVGCLGMF